jgi:uncharacterized protein
MQGMDRSSPFSFDCAACGKCCRDKRITLFPYEIARLAAACGTATGLVIEKYTDENGTVLLMRENDDCCVFLQNGRCSVHSGRPLSCRLYPLGRKITESGESFIETKTPPFCRGRRGSDAAISAFLDIQEVAPYLAAAAAYTEILRRMVTKLQRCEGAVDALAGAIGGAKGTDFAWLDVDAVVNTYCREKGRIEPKDLEGKIAIHLKAIEEWIERP